MDKDLNNQSKDKSTLTDKVGEAIEHLGKKISDLGMHGLGRKVHDIGDKVEVTHDDPTHPHDV